VTEPGEETVEEKRERAGAMAPRLAEAYPDLEISLDWSTPLELLVATILSAQCTDERVNRVTDALFERCRTPEDYAAIDREELEEIIRSTGFYRNKAKHIRGMAEKIVEEHDGEVPRSMEKLVELPGVARKTANVVLSNAFDTHVGVVVDTHVKRVSRRLGLATAKTPSAIEKELMEVLPEDQWRPFAWRLILHGRNVCHGRKDPECGRCFLSDLCPSAFTFGE
jgi:endonuclease-3